MVGHILLVVALVTASHSALSAYEYLSHLKAIGHLEGQLPQNIVQEALISMVLAILGACFNAPQLKEITWASEMKKRKVDEMDSRLGFANYVTRGKLFPPGPFSTGVQNSSNL